MLKKGNLMMVGDSERGGILVVELRMSVEVVVGNRMVMKNVWNIMVVFIVLFMLKLC